MQIKSNIMLTRILSRRLFLLSSVGGKYQIPKQPPSPATEYLLFPTNVPLCPFNQMVTKINPHLYQHLKDNNIQRVVAFPLKPGISKQAFFPLSTTHLQEEMRLRSQAAKDTGVSVERDAGRNNVVFEGSLENLEPCPFYFINSVNQIYPMGSLCTIIPIEYSQKLQDVGYCASLLAEIRYEINPKDYDNFEGPLCYLSGKTVKTEPFTEATPNFDLLLKHYDKVQKISILHSSIDRDASLKTLQLLTGFLCTFSFFGRDKLFLAFSTISHENRIDILTIFYQQYLQRLQADWKKAAENDRPQELTESAKRDLYNQLTQQLGQVHDKKFKDNIKLRMKNRTYPKEVLEAIDAAMQQVQVDHHDSARKKHYINLLVNYPFGLLADEELDLTKAKDILDEDHYGMKKLKERILEFIAVRKLKGEFKAKVLLLYGPPGVGKTSIVKSIAKCLNRPYGRISLGGEYDTVIIKGHRKTYLASYPGKLFELISRAHVQNPIILLDQIDKIQDGGMRGNLQNAIMEVLDPIQNTRFKDNFMDIEIDLSKVLFICTANTLETIFPPLLDRMEKIELGGYIIHEKQEIFRRHIFKQSMENNGIPDALQRQIQFTPQALSHLINSYCREAGVRNLVKKTNTVFQKMAYQLVKGIDISKQIGVEELQKYLGLPDYHTRKYWDELPPAGVIFGLAFNHYGGALIQIEAVATDKQSSNDHANSNEEDQMQINKLSTVLNKQKNAGKSSLLVTGNIQKVMKQSCHLAHTYAKHLSSTFFRNNFLEKHDVHLNFPMLDIGKDGPSAGVAITCALLSLALNRQAVKAIAMTGEITLSGNVRPIGGAKEKTIGAKREGISTLIFPFDNKADVEELDIEIRTGMTFYFVENFFEVMPLVFGLDIVEQIQ